MGVVIKRIGLVWCCIRNVHRGLIASFDIEVENGVPDTQGLVQTARPMPLAAECQ